MCTRTTLCYLAVRKKQPLLCVTVWTGPEGTVLREISRRQVLCDVTGAWKSEQNRPELVHRRLPERGSGQAGRARAARTCKRPGAESVSRALVLHI